MWVRRRPPLPALGSLYGASQNAGIESLCSEATLNKVLCLASLILFVSAAVHT